MYRTTLLKMGIEWDDLQPYTQTEIRQTNFLCNKGGGELLSRQVLAAIIVRNEPALVGKMESEANNRG